MIVKDYSDLGRFTARTISFNDFDEAGPVTIKRGPWTFIAVILNDWYVWANEFAAMNDKGEIVAGDFEKTVIASSQEALDDFLKYFHVEEWDYDDI